MTKYIIETTDNIDTPLRLKIFNGEGVLTDIIEGPTRFIMKWTVKAELGRDFTIKRIK